MVIYYLKKIFNSKPAKLPRLIENLWIGNDVLCDREKELCCNLSGLYPVFLTTLHSLGAAVP